VDTVSPHTKKLKKKKTIPTTPKANSGKPSGKFVAIHDISVVVYFDPYDIVTYPGFA
jgi:hypothetical protein